MKKSINYWTLGGFEGETPIGEAARSAARMGYEAIELCFGAGELTAETSEAELESLRSQVEEAGIEIASLATGAYWECSLSSADPAERETALAFTKAYIRAAAVLGTDAVLVVPGAVEVPFDPSKPVVPAKQVHDLSRASIEALLPTAREHGVAMALENVWNRFLTGPFELAAFIDDFGSPFVRSYFDVGNVVINGFPEHWIEVLADRIARVHVKGFQRRDAGGTLSDFTDSLLGNSVNWPAVMSALRSAGYDGYLTAEMIVSDKGLPDEELAGRVANEMDVVLKRKERVS